MHDHYNNSRVVINEFAGQYDTRIVTYKRAERLFMILSMGVGLNNNMDYYEITILKFKMIFGIFTSYNRQSMTHASPFWRFPEAHYHGSDHHCPAGNVTKMFQSRQSNYSTLIGSNLSHDLQHPIRQLYLVAVVRSFFCEAANPSV